MEEFKPNSFKSKEESSQKRVPLEKVISGGAQAKKKNEVQKFTEAFIKDDLRSIGSYILIDVIVPAIKRTILDSVKALLGETGTSSRGTTTASKVSYRSYYEQDSDRRRDYGAVTSLVRSGFDYDDILFESRGKAEAVLDAMFDLVNSQYGIVSVADMYDLADVSTDNYTLNNYGWTDLRGSKVVSTRDGYMIKLPRALPLK